jgi:hypothetical protein
MLWHGERLPNLSHNNNIIKTTNKKGNYENSKHDKHKREQSSQSIYN